MTGRTVTTMFNPLPVNVGSARESRAPVTVSSLGIVDYETAWALQRSIAAARAEGLGRDTLLLLEHPSVYTAGRRTAMEDLPRDGTPVIEVDRGGKITWHGPGQLVGYPIVKLDQPIDVVKYVRRIEEALITVCTGYGVPCGRVDGRSGVWLPEVDRGGRWLPERKIAAIGVRVQRGVALHGFSLNCNAALSGFDQIVPCGLRDVGVTTLTAELGRNISVGDVSDAVAEAIIAALDGELAVADHDISDLPRLAEAGAPRFTTVNFGA